MKTHILQTADKNTHTVTIEAFSMGLPYCGFKEYVTQIGLRLGARARELKERYGLQLRFVVPHGYRGCFGDDVEYMVYDKHDRHHIDRHPEWESDIYHMPTQYCKFRSMKRAGSRLLTVHDVNFMHNKKGLSKWLNKRKVRLRVKNADNLAFITHFAAEDTINALHCSNPYRVIYNGVTDLAGLPCEPVEGISPGFLFHLSSLFPNKRPELLVDMMSYLPSHTLVIVGVEKNAPHLKGMIEKHPNVVFLGNVSERQKVWLYANCSAFLFPSECEGFGLPPLEAMTLGKPVVMSPLTSLPEVGADMAWYWDEYTPEKMAQVVVSALEDFGNDSTLPVRIRKNALRFDWDKCVDNYISYYLDILGIAK